MVKGTIQFPFTMNHYVYCWNQPLNLVDLDGQSPVGAVSPRAISSGGSAIEQVRELASTPIGLGECEDPSRCNPRVNPASICRECRAAEIHAQDRENWSRVGDPSQATSREQRNHYSLMYQEANAFRLDMQRRYPWIQFPFMNSLGEETGYWPREMTPEERALAHASAAFFGGVGLSIFKAPKLLGVVFGLIASYWDDEEGTFDTLGAMISGGLDAVLSRFGLSDVARKIIKELLSLLPKKEAVSEDWLERYGCSLESG